MPTGQISAGGVCWTGSRNKREQDDDWFESIYRIFRGSSPLFIVVKDSHKDTHTDAIKTRSVWTGFYQSKETTNQILSNTTESMPEIFSLKKMIFRVCSKQAICTYMYIHVLLELPPAWRSTRITGRREDYIQVFPRFTIQASAAVATLSCSVSR